MQTDWKIAAAAIIGLSIVASALIFSGTDVMSGFFSLPAASSKAVQILVSLEEDKYSFDIQDAPSVAVQISSPDDSMTLQIGREKFDTGTIENLNLRVEGFTGRVELEDKKIILKGSAKKAFINGLGFKDKVNIILESERFNLLRAEKVRLNTFSHSVSGSLDADYGKTSVLLDKDSLNIGSFEGKLESEGSGLTLEGTAGRVSVAGKINIG